MSGSSATFFSSIDNRKQDLIDKELKRTRPPQGMTYNAGESLTAQEARHRRSDDACGGKQKQAKSHSDSVDVEVVPCTGNTCRGTITVRNRG